MNLDKSVLERMVQKLAGARKKEELSNFSKPEEHGLRIDESMEPKNNELDSKRKQDQNDLLNCEDGTDGNEEDTNEKDFKSERKEDDSDYKIVSIKEEGNEKKGNFLDSEKKGLLEKIREKIAARVPEKVEEKPLNVDEEFFQRFKNKLLQERREKAEKNEKEANEVEVIDVDNSNQEIKMFNNESFKVNSGILEDETQKGLFCEFIQKLKTLAENERKIALRNKAKEFEISLTELRTWIDAFELLLKVEKEIEISKQKLSEAEISVLFAKEFIKILKQNSSDKKYRLVKICNIVFKGLKLDSMKGAVWLGEFVKQNKNLLDFKLLEEFGIKPENLNKRRLVKREESNSEEKGHSKNIVSQKEKPHFPQKKINHHSLKKKPEEKSKKVESSSENEDSNESEKHVKVSPIISQKKPENLKTRKIEIAFKEPQPKKELKIEKKEQKEKEKISLIQKESVNALRVEMEKKLKAEREREKTYQERNSDELIDNKAFEKPYLTKYFNQTEIRPKESKPINNLYPESFCQKIANKLDEAFKSTVTKILTEKSEELCLDEETLKKFYKEYGTFLSLGTEKKCSCERFDKEELVERKVKPDITYERISNLNDHEIKKIEEKSNFESEFVKLAERSQFSLGKKARNEIEIRKPIERRTERLESDDEVDHSNFRNLSNRISINQPQKIEYNQNILKKPKLEDPVQKTPIEKKILSSPKEVFKNPLPPPLPPCPSPSPFSQLPLPMKESQCESKPSEIIINPYEYLSGKLLGFIERHQGCTENDIRKCAIKIATKSPKIQGKIKQDNLHIWIINFLQSRKNKTNEPDSGTNGLLNKPIEESQMNQSFSSPTPKIMIKNIPGQIETHKVKIPLPPQFINKGNEVNYGINQEKMLSFSKMGNRMPGSTNVSSNSETFPKKYHFD